MLAEVQILFQTKFKCFVNFYQKFIIELRYLFDCRLWLPKFFSLFCAADNQGRLTIEGDLHFLLYLIKRSRSGVGNYFCSGATL